MSITTRWKDNENFDIDNVISIITSPIEDDESTSIMRRIGWKVKKHFEQNQNIILFDSEFKFNFIKYSFEKVTDTDMVPVSGFVVVYSKDNQIYYIIDRNSDAQTILRKLLKYTKKNEIEKLSFSFSKDFFFWLINRVYFSNNISVTPDFASSL